MNQTSAIKGLWGRVRAVEQVVSGLQQRLDALEQPQGDVSALPETVAAVARHAAGEGPSVEANGVTEHRDGTTFDEDRPESPPGDGRDAAPAGQPLPRSERTRA